MNILSLFDGISCGQIALNRAGVKYDNYFASEVDKHAIKITQHNYPNTIQLGDIRNVFAKDLPKIDLIMGGSPCQGFSFAGKQLKFDDTRSKLFFEFARFIKECNPKYFLLENVRMDKESENAISKIMGVNPIQINSALVSAQNRERLYWTNTGLKPKGLFGEMYSDIPQPKDKGILLKDILEDEVDEKYYISQTALKRILNKTGYNPQINPEKTGTLNTKNNSGQLSVDNGTTLITHTGHAGELLIYKSNKSPSLKVGGLDDINIIDTKGQLKPNQQKAATLQVATHGSGNHSQMDLIAVVNDKGNLRELPNEKSLNIDANSIRRLTPLECARLQTIPDNYFYDTLGKQIISDTQIYKSTGNGWTVDIIVYILNYL